MTTCPMCDLPVQTGEESIVCADGVTTYHAHPCMDIAVASLSVEIEAACRAAGWTERGEGDRCLLVPPAKTESEVTP